jgi:hypothetical protein
MPKFGKVHFGKNYFGESELPTENWKRSYANIPLGIRVRRQLAKKVIFRVRKGNGLYGAKRGIEYQEKYRYFVPSSINNPQGQPARNALAAAVLNWKTILTNAEKQAYNKRAGKGLHMSGFNLYIREYIQANI